MLFQVDMVCCRQTAELPADAEHQVWHFIKEGRGIDTDEADLTLGAGDTVVNVLSDLVNVQVLALVDCTHVNTFRVEMGEHTDKHHTIRHSMEKILRVHAHGNAFLNEFVLSENFVEHSSNNVDFLMEEGVLAYKTGS